LYSHVNKSALPQTVLLRKATTLWCWRCGTVGLLECRQEAVGGLLAPGWMLRVQSRGAPEFKAYRPAALSLPDSSIKSTRLLRSAF
jgi:hypothetical protein